MRVRCLMFAGLLAAAAPYMDADQARDAWWRQDVSYLSAQLPARAANLFFVLPREQFDQSISNLMQAIPQLTDGEIMTEMARIVALAGDAHTSIPLTQRATGFRWLPLSLWWYEDGIYVRSAATPYRQALAAKLVQIGDTPIDQAYQAVSTAISHENDWWVRYESPMYLVMPDVLKALKVISTDAPVHYTFEDASGSRFSLDVDYAPTADWLSIPDANGFTPLMSRNADMAYWYLYLGDSRTLYFKYSQCVNMAGQPFSTFAAGLFALFDSNPVDRLIVDLRDNGGGDSSVLNPFLQGLQARQTRSSTTRVYVLFNRGTFSSAMLNAYSLRLSRDQRVSAGVPRAQAGILLGEPTGGNPTVPWRNGSSLALPNSGLRVYYTTAVIPAAYIPNSAVFPDVAVPTYSNDAFSRHDPVLAAALADAVTPGEPPNSPIVVANSASFRPGGSAAPGSLASAFGDFSGATAADATTVPLPDELKGTRVLVNGAAARLIAVRPGQINFQVPWATATGEAPIQVVKDGHAIATGTMTVAAVAPGLFSTDLLDPVRPGAVLNQDFSVNSDIRPAHWGDSIQIYGTGQGVTNPPADDGAAGPADPYARSAADARVYIGTASAEVQFSGLSTQSPGLWQLDVRVPAGLMAGPFPVFVAIGGAASNGVTVWIAP